MRLAATTTSRTARRTAFRPLVELDTGSPPETIRVNLTRHPGTAWQNGRTGPGRARNAAGAGRGCPATGPRLVPLELGQELADSVPVTENGWLTGRDTVFGVVAFSYAACALAIFLS